MPRKVISALWCSKEDADYVLIKNRLKIYFYEGEDVAFKTETRGTSIRKYLSIHEGYATHFYYPEKIEEYEKTWIKIAGSSLTVDPGTSLPIISARKRKRQIRLRKSQERQQRLLRKRLQHGLPRQYSTIHSFPGWNGKVQTTGTASMQHRNFSWIPSGSVAENSETG